MPSCASPPATCASAPPPYCVKRLADSAWKRSAWVAHSVSHCTAPATATATGSHNQWAGAPVAASTAATSTVNPVTVISTRRHKAIRSRASASLRASGSANSYRAQATTARLAATAANTV